MLGTHAKFREFTPKAICDTTQAVEVLLNLSCESRQEVDDLVAKAIAAGGTTYDKAEDFGFMYTHSFLDPDTAHRFLTEIAGLQATARSEPIEVGASGTR